MKRARFAVVSIVSTLSLLVPCSGGAREAPFNGHSVDASFDGARSVRTADVDGDGDLDIVASFSGDPGVAWWENDGTPADGGWLERPGIGWPANTVQAADMDRDGDTDVLLQTATSCYWLENDGTPATGDWYLNTVSLSRCEFPPNAVDIDRDGLTDVLGGGTVGSTYWIYWWGNDGDPWDPRSWILHPFAEARAHAASPADLDGDGDPDVLMLLPTEVTWWENDGSPVDGGWVEHLVATHGGSEGGSVLAADLDSDGDLDILATASTADDLIWWESDGADEVVWWQNRGGQFKLTAVDVAPTILHDGATAAVLALEFTHQGRSGDTAEDRDHDIPLTLEWAADVASSSVMFVSAQHIFADGFESGDTSMWSNAVP